MYRPICLIGGQLDVLVLSCLTHFIIDGCWCVFTYLVTPPTFPVTPKIIMTVLFQCKFLEYLQINADGVTIGTVKLLPVG